MTAEQKSLQGNIWKFAVFNLTNKRIFIVILSLYFLTVPDVSVQGIGLILFAGSLAGFIFELPSGYIADKIGHKKALVFSRICLAASSLAYLVADHISFLILGAVALSVGMSFNSGTASAFMYETLRSLGREKEYSLLLGKISSLTFIVPLIITLFVPFLVTISYKIPFAISLGIDLIGLAVAISFVTPPVPQQEIIKARISNLSDIIQDGIRNNFFVYALISGTLMGFVYAAEGYRAAYQAFLGVPIIWFGVYFALGRILTVVLLFYSGKIKSVTTIRTFYGVQVLVYGILLTLLVFSSHPWIVVGVFILIVGLQWGFLRVDENYPLERARESRFKATLMSTQAMTWHIVSAFAALGAGIAIEALGYQDGFLALLIGLLVLQLLFFLVLYTKGCRDNELVSL